MLFVALLRFSGYSPEILFIMSRDFMPSCPEILWSMSRDFVMYRDLIYNVQRMCVIVLRFYV